MRVEVKKAEETPIDRKKDTMDLLKSMPRKAVIFTRLKSHKEVVALIPSGWANDDRRLWVWLSGSDGAYVSSPSTLEDCAKTIVVGGWHYQADATMVVSFEG